MVRTRKRYYGEEVSQSSSNIAYSNRSRPKQFDQQEGKRQKRQTKSKESSCFTFDMPNKNYELLGSLRLHDATYVKLLEEVCNGQDRIMVNMGKNNKAKFWRNFAIKLCVKTGLKNNEGMEVACQQYCDDLKLMYKDMKKTGGLYPVNGHSPEYWGRLTRIFGGCTPSTSTERSSQSRGSTSSRRSVNKPELCDALAELAHSGDLDFDDIGRVEEYVTKCKTGLHVFMRGNKDYRASVVRKYLKNRAIGDDSQETEIPDSMWAPS